MMRHLMVSLFLMSSTILSYAVDTGWQPVMQAVEQKMPPLVEQVQKLEVHKEQYLAHAEQGGSFGHQQHANMLLIQRLQTTIDQLQEWQKHIEDYQQRIAKIIASARTKGSSLGDLLDYIEKQRGRAGTWQQPVQNPAVIRYLITLFNRFSSVPEKSRIINRLNEVFDSTLGKDALIPALETMMQTMKGECL